MAFQAKLFDLIYAATNVCVDGCEIDSFIQNPDGEIYVLSVDGSDDFNHSFSFKNQTVYVADDGNVQALFYREDGFTQTVWIQFLVERPIRFEDLT